MFRRHLGAVVFTVLALLAAACAGDAASTTTTASTTTSTPPPTTTTTVTTTPATTTTLPPTTTTTLPPTTTTTTAPFEIIDGPVIDDASLVNWDNAFAGEGVTQVPGFVEVYLGSGDDVVDLGAGLPIAVVTLNHRGRRNIIVEAIFDDGSDALLVNEIGAYQGRTLAYESGTDLVGVAIQADGDWVLIVTNILMAATNDKVARQYQGTGDAVIVFPVLSESPPQPVTAFSRVSLTHDGESNFIVQELLGPGLVNEIGLYSGTVRISADGLFGLEIIADGAWTVSFEE